jgi:uncharacterized protein YndB with AHSA1/START domain
MPVSSGSAKLTLPTDAQILVTREFDAPKQLVYKAWTTPELVARWWHANRGEIKSIDIDLRVGGAWRYVSVGSEGFEVAFHGEYREIVPDERLVYTEIYEGAPEGEALITVLFAELGDRTTVDMLMDYGSREVRDAVIQTGMEHGMQDALDLLEEVAVSLR